MKKNISIPPQLLDCTYYSGQDLYSDGDIEDEIFSFVRNNPQSKYEHWIKERKNWAVLYHLSYIRQNILAGAGISKDDNVLEIGSGMGDFTCEIKKTGNRKRLSDQQRLRGEQVRHSRISYTGKKTCLQRAEQEED